MPDRYLYLMLDLGAIGVPFLVSFYPKIRFASTFNRVIPAILIPMAIFIIWDVFFTKWGYWGFNDNYLIGIRFFGLPIEECLFFICIPFACLFTYFAFKHIKPITVQGFHYFGYLFGLGLIGVALFNTDKSYTLWTGIGLGVFLLYLAYHKKPYLAQFFLSYLLILIPFFLINGVLTGSWIDDQVVWYNNTENLGIRLGTIPVEDPFYGMLLLLMNTVIWEELGIKKP
jgi:lycopene cyclase domain-containing protein